MWKYLLTFLCFSLSLSANNGKVNTLTSPSGKIHVQVINKNGQLMYSVFSNRNEVVLPSKMLWEVNGLKLGGNVFSSAMSKGKAVKTSYPMLGNHTMAYNRYNPAVLTIVEKGKMTFKVELRAYDKGIAFRYLTRRDSLSKVNDFTTFRFPLGGTCWLQSNVKNYEGAYSRYEIGQFPDNIVAGPPVTLHFSSGLYASITEGNLVNFAGMGLKVIDGSSFQSLLGGETLQEGTIATPWRIVLIGSPNDLVNNDIITDVSAPRALIFNKNMDWIKPGNCVWSWLAGYRVTMDNMKQFSDWASQLGISYNLVDDGWGYWKDEKRGLNAWQLMKELVDYSAKKGVKIFVWKSYPKGGTLEGIETPERRQQFFQKCKEIGVAGVKLDFFDGENQRIIKYYEETLKDAAKYHLMVLYHGADKPTGLNRKYPNEVTREGIKGLEQGRSFADQDVVTPFTRFVAGHADYTPMSFQSKWMGNTTESHQIAQIAVFLSPFRCFGGRPEDYLHHPARDIFLSIPTTWDETIVLPPSEIGNCVVMARRKGSTWYLAAMTDLAKENISIPMSFLGKGIYQGDIISDSTTGEKGCVITHHSLKSSDKIVIRMLAGGGYLARLTLQ